MDNVITWLIVLFFIISFLNSILKPKKKNENQKKPSTGFPDDMISSGTTVPGGSDFDTEQIFAEEKEETFKAREIKDIFDRKYSENKPFDFSVDYDIEGLKKAVIASKTPEYKSQRSFPAKVEKKDEKAGLRKNIIQNLKSTQKVKEYVIMAEIIGKPKALKKRW